MKRELVVRYDVSDLTGRQVDFLAGEAIAQGEASEGHPSCSVSVDRRTIVAGRPAAVVAGRGRIRSHRSVWLLNIVEVPRPLVMGDFVADADGTMARVYEVRRMACVSSPVAGSNRDLFAVLHAGAGSIMVAVCLDGRQTEWSLPPCAISMRCLCAGHARNPAAVDCDTSELPERRLKRKTRRRIRRGTARHLGKRGGK